MDSDITYILYNLDIDNYISVLQTVLNFYKEDKIEFDIFDRFIFQDFIVSNMIAKNYQNKNLAYYLDSLLSDKELKNKMGIKFKPFQESIINLKYGISWNDSLHGLKILDKIQSPILEIINYE